LEDVLESCFIGGWEACGGDPSGMKFSSFEKGLRADIIALSSDSHEDEHSPRKVDFVMKDGQIFKQDGKAANLYADHHRQDQESAYVPQK
jgi:imidazolonepropionase-like amidohydrolase